MAITAAARKRQYEATLRREAYYARTDRPIKETVSKRPKTSVQYSSTLIKGTNGTISQKFEVQASERAINYFGNGTAATGLTALGLVLASAATDPLVASPKFWVPAKVNVGVGMTTPVPSKSPWQTRVVKSKSATYSAPISSNVPNVTYDILDARAKAIYSDLGARLGDSSYAAFYLSPEMFNNHKV